MRFSILAATAAAVALSGCVMTAPGATVPTAPPPVVVTPPKSGAPVVVTPAPKAPVTPPVKTVDAGSARQVVSAELARRYPGKNVGPMADCIISNATMAEQADLVSMKGTPAASNAMAAIVKKPATSACLAKAIA